MNIQNSIHYQEFKDRWALITGASQGIGLSTAEQFAKQGCHLILIARQEQKLKQLQSDLISRYSIQVLIFALDISVPENITKIYENIPELDYAINNAAMVGDYKKIQELTLSEYNTLFNTNVMSVFLSMQKQVQYFLKNKKSGAIINLASIVGIRGVPGKSLYSASKHAVIGLTRSVGIEQITNNIRVNCISPGSTKTPMLEKVMGENADLFIQAQPNKKLLEPIQIASTILWLCSDASNGITAENIVVDGGRTIALI